jgi:hypothetical protein
MSHFMKKSGKSIYSVGSFYGAVLLLILSFTLVGCGEDSSGGSSGGSSGISSARLRAMRASSVNNLKQLGMAVHMYLNDYDAFLPDDPGLIMSYVSPDVFIAPFDKVSKPLFDRKAWEKLSIEERAQAGKQFTSANTSYAFIIPSGMKCRYVPLTTPIAFEKPWLLPEDSDEIAVFYMDGHVESVKFTGVSAMSCREVTEKLTVGMPTENASLRNKMLEIAGRLDVERKSAENSEPEHKAPVDNPKDKYRQPIRF